MLKWLTEFVTGKTIGLLLEGYKAKLAATNTSDKHAVDLALADINAERARREAQRDLGIAAMNHPVWWIAWGLFVIPVGIYNAAIFLLSTAGIGPETFAVLRVPGAQEALMGSIIQSIFLAQGVSGIAGAVIKRFGR
jgi:hypothetical protein